MIEVPKKEESEISYSLFMDITESLKKGMKQSSYDCYVSKNIEMLYWDTEKKLRLIGLEANQSEDFDIKLEEKIK